jgi:exosortase A-associated hydrolase 2
MNRTGSPVTTGRQSLDSSPASNPGELRRRAIAESGSGDTIEFYSVPRSVEDHDCPPPEGCFLDGAYGRVFTLYRPPCPGIPCQGNLLYVHSFGEELNCSREPIAMVARGLQKLGFGTLGLDCYGCGDSEGDIRDARWEIWENNIQSGLEWLRRRSPLPVDLWGLRLGALLALSSAARTTAGLRRIILWQPILRGDTFIRSLQAGAGLRGAAGKEAVRDSQPQIGRGEYLDLFGYHLSPELVSAIGRQNLASMWTGARVPVVWVAFVSDRNRDAPPAVTKVISQWRSEGAAVTLRLIAARAFWTMPDTAGYLDDPGMYAKRNDAMVGQALGAFE